MKRKSLSTLTQAASAKSRQSRATDGAAAAAPAATGGQRSTSIIMPASTFAKLRAMAVRMADKTDGRVSVSAVVAMLVEKHCDDY